MKITLPPLHDLSDWSFSGSNVAGPHFEHSTTFDRTTLETAHRYKAYSDCERINLVLNSGVFDGEVACHTSLIKLRRMVAADLWISVERWNSRTNSWTVLN